MGLVSSISDSQTNKNGENSSLKKNRTEDLYVIYLLK